MASSIVPYTLTILKSHIELVFHPSIVDGAWSELNALGDSVSEELRSRKQPICLVDLSELNYMGSSVVALIVRVWKNVNTNGGKMAIVTDHPLVKEIIALAGLDKIWSIYPHPNIARKSLGVPINSGSTSSQYSNKRILVLFLFFATIAGVGAIYLATR